MEKKDFSQITKICNFYFKDFNHSEDSIKKILSSNNNYPDYLSSSDNNNSNSREECSKCKKNTNDNEALKKKDNLIKVSDLRYDQEKSIHEKQKLKEQDLYEDTSSTYSLCNCIEKVK